MIMLIFAVLSLLVISLWLANKVIDLLSELHEIKKERDRALQSAEIEWMNYIQECRKNRSKALLIKELQEENAELEELLAHKELELDNANELADGWAEAYSRVLCEWKVVLQEKEALEDKVDELETYIMEIEYGDNM